MGSTCKRAQTGGRAQSETVGFVLIIGFVLLGSMLVVAFGAFAIGDAEDSLSEDRAEKALTQFDSKAALVALGESDAHRASFGTGATDRDELTVEEENGWMRLVIADRHDQSNAVQVMNITLGAIVYEGNDEVRLAYQGGGVWRSDPDGGQMISPPEFHYRGETLTLPAISISGDSLLNDEVTIERTSTTQYYPNETQSFENPVRNRIINVTVGSEFYRGWGRYFTERTDGEVTYDDERERTSLTLTSPIGDVRAESIIAGQQAGGVLRFQGNPHHPCEDSGSHPPYVDGYNSSQGSYCEQYDHSEVHSAGDIIFGENITTEDASAQIQGNLVSGDAVNLHGNLDVHGNISHVSGCYADRGPADDCADVQTDDRYWVEEIDELDPSPRIDFAIDNAADEIYEHGEPVTVEGNPSPRNPQTTDHLESGEYYTDEIDLSGAGDRVVFDTTDGDISLVVNETIHVDNNANLSVVGDNDANIYVDGLDEPSASQHELRVTNDAEIFAPNHDAGKLTILGKGEFTGLVDDASVTGVVYAPVGDDGSGSMEVFGEGSVFGAAVTGDLTVGGTGGVGGGAGGSLHYDQTLFDQQVVPPDWTIVRLTFLHVTENHITVSG